MRPTGSGLLGRLPADLEAAGFADVTTAVLRYPLGGGTASGQRWWAHRLTTIVATRLAVVDVGGLVDGAEFDRKVALLAEAPTLLERKRPVSTTTTHGCQGTPRQHL